ncbi:T9SS type A sorting domain-containing protein [Hymenobacter sp. HMF4947]|uniref:T9SS type A sorting domain-containing protein n=1 Tax=Hymenobacter ginkgonis TaxID=2682976 RepID=A0A7K1TDV5_9BACT|nr:IPT/TIG domain-containing protein [Hymenobacter ginkgonis]MVN76586.1 T9SS type A sorting domain-containing protein [Hymenobacter ginkgonis]
MKCFYPLRTLAFLGAAFSLVPTLASAAPFKPGNIVVARVGDGSAALSAVAAAVFLDEYTPSGTLVQSIDLPTAVNGNNRILTASGNATSELNLTRSADGHYLVLAGYGAAPGTGAVTASQAADVTRVIGLIGADGSLDTSTSTGDAFNGVSIRAAATVDGTSFYSVGGNSGVRYQAFGTFGSTQLTTAPTNIRSVSVAGGNLYISTASSPYFGLSQVGTGLPTTAQTAAVLPGFPGTATGSSPYGFYLADLSTDVPGVDVAYVADDRTTTAGGIQKWSLVAGSWVLNGTITSTAAAAVRGLNGSTSGTSVSLVASSGTGLFVLADNAGYNAAPSVAALPAAIATAGTNTAFRGLAFAPVAAAPVIASFTPASGPVGTTVTVTGTNLTGATALTLNGAAVTGFTVVNATTLTFVVPAGATSGTIAVTTPGGTATSTSAFSVTAPVAAPTITSFTPTTGSAGTTVTITGTGFTGATAVSIGSLAIPTYTVVSATSITLVLPAATASVSGLLTVVTPGGTATSATPFNLVVLGAAASQALPGLAVYPNPATDYLVVELPQAGAATVALRDLTGRVVLAPVALVAHQPLRLPAGLAAGLYLLEVRQGSATAVRRVAIK